MPHNPIITVFVIICNMQYYMYVLLKNTTCNIKLLKFISKKVRTNFKLQHNKLILYFCYTNKVHKYSAFNYSEANIVIVV